MAVWDPYNISYCKTLNQGSVIQENQGLQWQKTVTQCHFSVDVQEAGRKNQYNWADTFLHEGRVNSGVEGKQPQPIGKYLISVLLCNSQQPSKKNTHYD